jgi:Alpha-kinase family
LLLYRYFYQIIRLPRNTSTQMPRSSDAYLIRTDATLAYFDTSVVFAQGSFKDVYSGRFYNDDKSVRSVAIKKRFKGGCVYENHYFDMTMRVHERCIDLITRFNNERIAEMLVYLVEPQLWYNEQTEERSIVEPLLHCLKKFNSNTGWTSQEDCVWFDTLQALSHFSYNASNGELLLCDIQGSVSDNSFTMTDPVIMSTDMAYGPSDLGCPGIATFFARHLCNSHCNPSWIVPSLKRMFYECKKGSEMTLPTEQFSRLSLNDATSKEEMMNAQFADMAILSEDED